VPDVPVGQPSALAVLRGVRDAAGDGLPGVRLPAAAGGGALLPSLRVEAGGAGSGELGPASAWAYERRILPQPRRVTAGLFPWQCQSCGR